MSSGVHTKTSETDGSASMVINASAAQLWPLISDPTKMGQFSPENTRAVWRDGATGVAVGARFRGFNRRGPAVWYTECLIKVCEVNRRFSFDVSFPVVLLHVARWTWTLEQSMVDPNSTKVTVSWNLPGPIGWQRRLFWRGLGVGNREVDLAAGTTATLRRLAEFVESR